jgi:hypothetical protein
MKPLLALLLLCLTPAWCQQLNKKQVLDRTRILTPPPVAQVVRVPLETIRQVERSFNNEISTVTGVNEPMELMGDTRGIQLMDYGLVFTSEVSLVVTPGLMPGRPKIPPEMAARVHQLRVERMPLLKEHMMWMMRKMAATFTQIPASQQLVLVVRLYYGAWEDTTGMPAQVVMKATRAALAAGKVETEER